MKKTILVILMAVMLATPCFAQEVEPEGMFSIEGTVWEALPIFLQLLPFPWIGPPGAGWYFNIGFWGGEIYPRLHFLYDSRRSFYVDMLAISIFMYQTGGAPGIDINFGILQPIGIGMWIRFLIMLPPYSFTGIFPSYYLTIMPLIKTDDEWTPPHFGSISPSQGEQGTTLTEVLLYTNNTSFKENPPIQINFDPPYDLMVTNINVISNTEIEFDLEIGIDAPIGLKTIYVQYDNFNQTVRGHDAFEVLPKTN